MTDRELLRHIERSPGQRAGYKHLVRILGLGGGRERRLLLEHLSRLTAAGRLVKVDKEHWTLAQAAHSRDNLVAGRLDLHRDGYGFVRPAQRDASGDIFIPPNEIGTAMQGDQVLVEVFPKRPGEDRMAGRIVRVLTRRNPTVVGKFHYGSVGGSSGGGRRGTREPRYPGHYVVPFDERMTQPVMIPLDEPLPEAVVASPHRVLGEEVRQQFEDLEGLVVDVEITEWPTPTRPARGRVMEVLGEEDAFGVDVEMMIRKHHLPHVFPENVLAEAREVAHLDGEVVAARRDFRDLPVVTIDGETARDFDDAVLVREHGDGTWELQVHIADVAQYVTPESALDLEARLRGTSVYFPDRAIPMLPQELSTDICSLRPGEDRLVLSCLMQMDAHGQVTGYEVTEGVICSAQRMTYTQVQAILDGDAVTREQFAPLVPEFERMYRLAQILNAKRERRGSIDFDLPEPVIEFDEFGAMKAVTRAERLWANRLIEEFMLSANECVASWLENLAVPAIYRIHEKPEPRRVVEFEEIAASFGYSLGIGNLPVKRFHPRGERRDQRRDGRGGRRETRAHEVAEDIAVTPQMYQKLTAKLAGKPEERIVAYLMLRSLKQARYSEKNEGHFALAAPAYTHFTSPIRRYPDLMVHRIAKALLGAGVDGHGVVAADSLRVHKAAPRDAAQAQEAAPFDEPELAAIAQETSDTERRAAEAERELVEWKKIKFMRDRVGEDFDALILSATKYGLFVELEDLFIEGLVPIQSLGALDGDRYSYRENTREIIGDGHGRKFRMGQRVRVLLERVDAMEKRLQFSILLDEEEATAARKPRGKSKSAGSSKTSAKKTHAAAASEKKPARTANPKKSGRKKKRFSADAVPDFAKRVAQPPPRGHKKGKKRKPTASAQQITARPAKFAGKKPGKKR
jgi:ribonuclease R